MNRITAALTLAVASASLALLAGCNSAPYTTPPAQDAGPLCSTLAPIIQCDAGGPASASVCVADPTSSDTVVAQIPTGNYPVGCTVQFYFEAYGGGCTPADNSCTCLSGDAGPDANAPAGQWSNCQDAGLSAP
jgi:hypothetical protein